jgi:hypothetical protein
VQTTDAPITVGTTATVWVQFTGAQSIVAGNGLTSTGNTINVVGGTGILSLTDNIEVRRVPPNWVPLMYAGTVGDGSSTTISVNHNLTANNSGSDVMVMVFDIASKSMIDCDIAYVNTNQLNLIFAVAPALNSLRVVVLA